MELIPTLCEKMYDSYHIFCILIQFALVSDNDWCERS